jgi:hypothetical protein
VSVSQPNGYRIPGDVRLTALSRTLASDLRTTFRDEAARAVASVIAELLDADTDTVLRRLSHGQLGIDDLIISPVRASDAVLSHAAEFVELLHAHMHRPSALPMPTHLDLRCWLQFFDDPDGDSTGWTYVLLGTGSDRLEQAWQAVAGVEPFAVTAPDQRPDRPEADAGWVERAEVWDRVTAPLRGAAPLTWQAPEPELLFDIAESQRDAAGDSARAASGRLTVPAVLAALAAQLGTEDHAALRSRILPADEVPAGSRR